MRGSRILVAMVVVGVVGRVVMAFATFGVLYDIDSERIVAETLRVGDNPYPLGRWPYPPGFFPVIWLSDVIARATGLPFHGVVQLPAIAADAVLAVVIARFRLSRGASETHALAAAALVALGPSFAIISGYHGQIDAIAILPAVLGAIVWIRGYPGRAPAAGALIGIGAAIKTVPLFSALALLPTVRGRREAAHLVGAAVLVPLLVTAPYLARDAHGTLAALRQNHGVPGFGGLSAFLEPELTRYWSGLPLVPPQLNAAIDAVTSAQNAIVAACVLAVAGVLVLRRTDPLDGLALLWLTVLAVNPNFAYQYVVWTLPFLLLAGRLGTVALLQAVLVVPAVLLYSHLDKAGWVYWATIQAAWLAIVGAWLVELRNTVVTAAPAPRRAVPSTSRP